MKFVSSFCIPDLYLSLYFSRTLTSLSQLASTRSRTKRELAGGSQSQAEKLERKFQSRPGKRYVIGVTISTLVFMVSWLRCNWFTLFRSFAKWKSLVRNLPMGYCRSFCYSSVRTVTKKRKKKRIGFCYLSNAINTFSWLSFNLIVF